MDKWMLQLHTDIVGIWKFFYSFSTKMTAREDVSVYVCTVFFIRFKALICTIKKIKNKIFNCVKSWDTPKAGKRKQEKSTKV